MSIRTRRGSGRCCAALFQHGTAQAPAAPTAPRAAAPSKATAQSRRANPGADTQTRRRACAARDRRPCRPHYPVLGPKGAGTAAKAAAKKTIGWIWGWPPLPATGNSPKSVYRSVEEVR